MIVSEGVILQDYMGVGGYEHLVFRDCKYIMLSPKMAEEHLTRSIFFSEDEATD